MKIKLGKRLREVNCIFGHRLRRRNSPPAEGEKTETWRESGEVKVGVMESEENLAS